MAAVTEVGSGGVVIFAVLVLTNEYRSSAASNDSSGIFGTCLAGKLTGLGL